MTNAEILDCSATFKKVARDEARKTMRGNKGNIATILSDDQRMAIINPIFQDGDVERFLSSIGVLTSDQIKLLLSLRKCIKLYSQLPDEQKRLTGALVDGIYALGLEQNFGLTVEQDSLRVYGTEYRRTFFTAPGRELHSQPGMVHISLISPRSLGLRDQEDGN